MRLAKRLGAVYEGTNKREHRQPPLSRRRRLVRAQNGRSIAEHSVTFPSERYQHRHAFAVIGVGALVQLLDQPLFFQPSFHPNSEEQ
jgi:hypothetical protein